MSPQSHPPAPPVALTIAGSDPSAGAGLQADLKTFAAHRVYGLATLTCSTAQVPGRVTDISPVSPDHLRAQLDLLFATYPIAAIKTGMLCSIPLMQAVIDALPDPGSAPPLVVDPVMVASSGHRLLDPDAVDYYRRHLLPRATLFTPNLDEAAVLLDLATPIAREAELEPSAIALFERYESPVLLKGGHLRGERAIDVLVTAEGVETYSAPFVEGFSTHGTGCTYSAAITARLAAGTTLTDAVAAAKRYISAAIAGSFRWPGGADALDHPQASQEVGVTR